MSVRRKSSKKALSAFTSLMVLFALMVPFAGTALAQHVSGITLTPETDTAPANTCNAFTVTLTGPTSQTDPNPGVLGETIDVIVQDSDTENPGTVALEAGSDFFFCQPPAGNDPAGAETGPNPQSPRPGQTRDLAPGGATQANGFTFTNGSGQTEFCCTDVNGQLTFGIQSNEPGTFAVTAFYDDRQNAQATDGDDQVGQGDFADTSQKTFTAAPATGNQGVRTLDCNPETDVNPEGTAHSFNCVATDANGNTVSGVTVQFDVTAGPNAEEVGPTTCQPSTTDAQGNTTPGSTNPNGTPNPAVTGVTGTNGQVTCTYTDTENDDASTGTQITSPPGTDTIIGFVNQTPAPGQGGSTPGADTFEPQDQITKTFVGDANNIDCTGPANAQAGSIVTITCRVTDEAGQPVPNVDVNFTETGAGAFRGGVNNCTTGADGTCSVQIETNASEAGQNVVVTGTIGGANSTNTADSNGFVGQTNCNTNGTPQTGTNAVCSDTVTVALTSGTTPPPPPPTGDCNDGVDNDGDGRIDFPNDTGCQSATDPSEVGGTTGNPEVVNHPRTIKITRIAHVRLPGKDKPALLIKGVVTAPSFEACASNVPVKVQIRAGGEFITRKTDTTNGQGVFKVLIRDVAAQYRARATRFEIADPSQNVVHVCQKATDKRRHRH